MKSVEPNGTISEHIYGRMWSYTHTIYITVDASILNVLAKLLTKILNSASKLNITTFQNQHILLLRHKYKAKIHAHTWEQLRNIVSVDKILFYAILSANS